MCPNGAVIQPCPLAASQYGSLVWTKLWEAREAMLGRAPVNLVPLPEKLQNKWQRWAVKALLLRFRNAFWSFLALHLFQEELLFTNVKYRRAQNLRCSSLSSNSRDHLSGLSFHPLT